MDGAIFLQQVVNGMSLGGMYALIAIGYTMVYGVLRLINFAHADVMAQWRRTPITSSSTP